MTFDPMSKKARSKLISSEKDICKLLFTHSKTQHACRIFLEWLKNRGGECTRSELSQFGRDLEAGKIEEGFTYRRENFYRLIRRRLMDLGFINLQARFYPVSKKRIIDKYAPIRQPIPKRGPDGQSFFKLAYLIAKRWNEEFEKK